MLNLIYTKSKARGNVLDDCRLFFDTYKKLEWFQDSNAQIIMKHVDKVKEVDGWRIISRDGIPIPPEYLSTGTKAILCIMFCPDIIFNATQLGDNVLGFLQQICKKQDRTVLVYHYIPEQYLEGLDLQKDYKPFDLKDYDDYYDEWIKEGLGDV